MFYRITTFIASALFASSSFAWDESDTVSVTAMFASYHADRDAGYNERNPGLGLEWATGDYRGIVGHYVNSYKLPSSIVAVAWLPVKAGPFNVGGLAGFVSGYPAYDLKPGPTAAAMVEYKYKKFGINLVAIPEVSVGKVKTSAVVSFQVKMEVM